MRRLCCVVLQVGNVKLVSSSDVAVDAYSGSVTFQTVKKSDEGRYACTAINDVGSDAAYTQLRVLGKLYHLMDVYYRI